MSMWKNLFWTLVVVACVACGACASARPPTTKTAPAANEDGAVALCFGGPPQIVASEAGWAPIEGAGHWEQPSFLVAEGQLLWASDVIHQLDLATMALSMKGLQRPMLLVAVKNGEAWAIEDGHAQTFGGDLFAMNLRTGEERTVLPGGMPQRDSLYLFDGADLYFIRDGEKQSSFMRLRADSGQTEFLGHEPQGLRTAFRVDHGFVYWNREVSRDEFQLSRRALTLDSPITKLAATKTRHMTLALGHGKVFYLDEGSLYSVPIDGSQPPSLLVDETGPREWPDHLLVDDHCAYWTNQYAIMRVRLDGAGPTSPEIVADDATYRGGTIATDGKFLYWQYMQRGGFLRVGRDARAVSPTPALVAKPVAPPHPTISANGSKPVFAVVDFPPPPGTQWPKDRQIHRDCKERAAPLPTCAPGARGETWASLVSKATELKDQTIVVRDRLVVGPFVSNPGGAPNGPQSRALALGEGKKRLPFIFGQPKLWCTGDESRLCCRTQAFGQLVIATGKLGGSKVHGWDLRSAELCEVPDEHR